MKSGAPPAFGAQLKTLREAAGYTQEELATIAGLSVHAVSALERGERRRPHVDTVRALAAALDLTGRTRDAFVASARASADQTAATELTGTHLPAPPTSLVGRAAEMDTLTAWFADPSTRLVTLVGPGGVGKTRLAIEAARVIADQQNIRAIFVLLAAIRDAGLAACAVAESLGLADISSTDLPQRARVACERQPTVLLLDNLEQVPDGARLIAELLGAAINLRVLATSRAPLRIRGERECLVSPLALGTRIDGLSPGELAGIPAVRLFVERARDVDAHFQLTTANAAAVVAICRRLDALPLAIELAARWVKVLSVAELQRRLDDEMLLSIAGSGDLPERQRTMNAAVAWSYQLLDARDRRAFRRLGALRGQFSINAATHVLASDGEATDDLAALDAVASLIDKSLLLRDAEAGTNAPLYRMLEPIRAFASRELLAAGEEDDARAGLARYALAEAAQAAAGLAGPAQVEWLDRVHADLDNYRDAMEWLIGAGRHGDASAVAWGLLSFWFIRGYAAEGLWWYQEIVRLPSLSRADEARTRVGLAAMAYAQREMKPAREAAERALSLATDIGDPVLAAVATMFLGHIEYAFRRFDVARDHFSRSLETFRRAGIPWGIGNALTGLANIALARGDFADAEAQLDEATTQLAHSGPWYLALVLTLRAVLAVSRQDPQPALGALRETFVRVRELRDTFAFVHALVPLAGAALLVGEPAWAARVLGARDEIAARSGIAAVDYVIRELRDRAEQDARAALGLAKWSASYEAGRSASFDALLAGLGPVPGAVE